MVFATCIYNSGFVYGRDKKSILNVLVNIFDCISLKLLSKELIYWIGREVKEIKGVFL